jgi:hypothetical protein
LSVFEFVQFNLEIFLFQSVADSSSFSPYVTPRPAYPSFFDVALRAGRYYLHDVVLGIAFVIFLTSPYQKLKSYLEESFDCSERAFYAVTIGLAHTGSFIVFNGGVALGEYFGWMQKYKIYRKPAEVPEPALMKKLYTEAFFNHLFVTPGVAFALFFAAR